MARTNFVKTPSFEEYKELFKEHAELKREDGIIQVTFHTNGGPCWWSERNHNAYPLLMKYIGMDRENQVLIWTHAGEQWMTNTDPEGWSEYAKDHLQFMWHDAAKLIQNMVFDIDIPTIGVVNGPGFHWDTAIMCDITIASEDARWDDFHYQDGTAPGDGMSMMMQHLLGTKRANYLMYTCRQWDAKTALEWGWINEIVPKDKLIERAWELARIIMEAPRATREITSSFCKRPIQKLIVEDLKFHVSAEGYAHFVSPGGHESDGTAMMKFRFDPNNLDLLKPPTLGCNKVTGISVAKSKKK